MSTSDLIQKYFWLLRAFMSGPISKEEIDLRWSRSSLNEQRESAIPRTSFFRFRNELERLFGVDVKCDQDGRYYIETANDQVGELQQWLLSSMSVNNMLMECQNMRDRIVLENFPNGTQFLPSLVDAIQNSLYIIVHYASFKHEPRKFSFAPYALRVFERRWYMIGESSDHPGQTRVYALDRIQTVHSTSEHYDFPASFNVKEFFHGRYGVTVGDDVKPTHVRIRVQAASAPYLRSLPIHESQMETEKAKDYSIFEYFVAPTIEFRKQILALGSDAEVLAPDSFRTEVINIVNSLYQQYNKK